MGETIRLKCNDCKRSFDLDTGHGRYDNDLERVLAYFDDRTAEIIKAKLSAAGCDAAWSYRKMIGYCSSCGSIKEIPTFHITDNENKYTVAAKCECGGDPALYDPDDPAAADAVRCPDCHGTMTVEHLGIWD